MVEAQSQLQSEILGKVQVNRGERVVASRGSLPNFAVGEYVLVARVRRSGSTPKLLMTWPACIPSSIDGTASLNA